MTKKQVPGRGKGDIVAYGSVLAIAIGISLLAVTIFYAFSTEMSMKEFLDRNLNDSLDGDLKAYAPGDEIEILDEVHSTSLDGTETVVYLVSTHGTEYEGRLRIEGDHTDDYQKGDRVEITLTIIISSEDEREVFAPLTSQDIEVV